MKATEQVPLLEIKNLTIGFNKYDQNIAPAIKNVSLTINNKEIVALVGESGSGKSVTAHSILKLLPDSASYLDGKIIFNNRDLLKITGNELRAIRGNQIAMIFQEPMNALNPLHTIEKQISESLILHKGLDKKTARQHVIELLNLVGINNAEKRLNSYPHQLSGGQRQRIVIAMALANNPKLLIADEPTTALDVTIQIKILELLKSLQDKFDMAILLISHDLNLVRRFAQRVCVMKDGEIVEENNTELLFNNPQHSYSKKLINSEPSGSPAQTKMSNSALLEIEKLHVWFPLEKRLFCKTKNYLKAVNDISFSLTQGQTLGIVGESGSGKSTLAFAILKLIKSQGLIRFLGQRLDYFDEKKIRPLRRHMQIVFQDPFGSLSPRMSVAQIISEGLYVHNIGSIEDREKIIIQSLIDVGLDPETRNRYPHEFSGGQRQRIAIARALVLKPKLIVLDEPTSALDRSVQQQVIDLLRSLQEKYNLTYLFISHDLAVIRALSHQLLVIKEGVAVEQGDAQAIFSAPQHPYTQQLLAAAFMMPTTTD